MIHEPVAKKQMQNTSISTESEKKLQLKNLISILSLWLEWFECQGCVLEFGYRTSYIRGHSKTTLTKFSPLMTNYLTPIDLGKEIHLLL